jgi:hypothetical protein
MKPTLPDNWFVDQTGSCMVSYSDRAPLSSSCIDVAATIARNKPTYAVQHEAARPSPKILIITDYTLLVPLTRFRARTRQTLRNCFFALQGPKPFRIFVPTVSVLASDGSLCLIEASTWNDLVDLLARMTPLSKQELEPLVAAASLPADLVMILDHSENVFGALNPLLHCPATDTSVSLSEMNFEDLSNRRFVFDKVSYAHGACVSILAEWCRRTPKKISRNPCI